MHVHSRCVKSICLFVSAVDTEMRTQKKRAVYTLKWVDYKVCVANRL